MDGWMDGWMDLTDSEVDLVTSTSGVVRCALGGWMDGWMDG